MSTAKRNIVNIHCSFSSNDLAIVIPVFRKQDYIRAVLPYQSKTILEYQITTLNRIFPQAEIFVVIGYESSHLLKILYRKSPVRLITNDLYLSTNTTYSISLALQASRKNSLLIINGNVLFNDSIIKITQNKTGIISGNTDKDLVGVFLNNNKVTGFSYSFDRRWLGVAFLQEKEFETFSRMSLDEKNANLFEYEIFNRVIEQGGEFHNIELPIRIIDKITDLK